MLNQTLFSFLGLDVGPDLGIHETALREHFQSPQEHFLAMPGTMERRQILAEKVTGSGTDEECGTQERGHQYGVNGLSPEELMGRTVGEGGDLPEVMDQEIRLLIAHGTTVERRVLGGRGFGILLAGRVGTQFESLLVGPGEWGHGVGNWHWPWLPFIEEFTRPVADQSVHFP